MNNQGQHNQPDSLEEFFSKNLRDGAMEPSARSWEHIELVLDQDKKEKRRRGIFWIFFSGIALLIGLSTLWFLLLKNNPVQVAVKGKDTAGATGVSVTVPPASSSGDETTATDAAASSVATATASTSNVNTSVTNPASTSADLTTTTASATSRIQLGAYRRQLKGDRFHTLGQPVESETGADGLTRYYILSNDTVKDLERIRTKGFSDAFVQKESDRALIAAAGKRTGTSSAEPIAQRNPTKRKSKDAPNGSSDSNTVLLANNTANSDPAAKKGTKKSRNNRGSSALTPAVAGTITVVSTSTHSPGNTVQPVKPVVTDPPVPVAANNHTADNGIIDPATKPLVDHGDDPPPPVLQSPVLQKQPSADSMLAAAPPAKDSLPKPVKADSTSRVANTKKDQRDSTPPQPFDRWAVSAIGGPVFFLNAAKEKLPFTWAGNVHGEYFFLKNLSGSVGVTYQEHNLQQDTVRFKFSKYINSDYTINSSLGPMTISKDLLLQGFFMQAPIDTFAAQYKYTVNVKSIGVPVQLNWYFLNNKVIRASIGGGFVPMYTLSQSSHLSLIKEHHVDELSYGAPASARKLNMVLMLSLGCDVRVYKRLYFTAAPSYRYSATNYSNVPGMTYKPAAFSVMGGFKLRW